MNTKAFIEGCPPEEVRVRVGVRVRVRVRARVSIRVGPNPNYHSFYQAETSINHACVMYKEAMQPGAEPTMFEQARPLVEAALRPA